MIRSSSRVKAIRSSSRVKAIRSSRVKATKGGRVETILYLHLHGYLHGSNRLRKLHVCCLKLGFHSLQKVGPFHVFHNTTLGGMRWNVATDDEPSDSLATHSNTFFTIVEISPTMSDEASSSQDITM